MNAHITIGDDLEDIEARAQSAALLTDQLAAMTIKHQQAQAASTFNEERARTAELAQQDLIRAHNAHTTALGQTHAQAADLGDRLMASIAAKREASARSNQQAASLVESATRLQQQLERLCVNVTGPRRRSTL